MLPSWRNKVVYKIIRYIIDFRAAPVMVRAFWHCAKVPAVYIIEMATLVWSKKLSNLVLRANFLVYPMSLNFVAHLSSWLSVFLYSVSFLFVLILSFFVLNKIAAAGACRPI